MTLLNEELTEKRNRLLDLISRYGSCAIAYSGGVDSALVAKAAQVALSDAAVAVTAVSPSLAEGELEQAVALAIAIGIRHQTLETNEFANPSYSANSPDRCFHCKSELYAQLSKLADTLGVTVIASGTNADDLSDFRPGLAAASNYGVRSPLADCGIVKAEVRRIAAAWQLPVAEKPASPCLSSRVAYGLSVTPERLKMIDRAERLIRTLGISVCRVRFHAGNIARIEVPCEAIVKLTSPEAAAKLTEEFLQLGFTSFTIDPAGFRSGSLNDSTPLHQLS